MDVGVIGVGTMGKNHVRVYSELKGVNSVGIYDVNTRLRKRLVKSTVQQYTDQSSELLDNSDAVSVCVPTQFHQLSSRQVFSAEKIRAY